MIYKSQREKIKDFFDNKLIPSLDKDYWKALDYKKIIGMIAEETGSSEAMVIDVLNSLINAGKLSEERTISLSQSRIEEVKKRKMEIIENEFKEVGLS